MDVYSLVGALWLHLKAWHFIILVPQAHNPGLTVCNASIESEKKETAFEYWTGLGVATNQTTCNFCQRVHSPVSILGLSQLMKCICFFIFICLFIQIDRLDCLRYKGVWRLIFNKVLLHLFHLWLGLPAVVSRKGKRKRYYFRVQTENHGRRSRSSTRGKYIISFLISHRWWQKLYRRVSKWDPHMKKSQTRDSERHPPTVLRTHTLWDCFTRAICTTDSTHNF